MSDTFIGDFAGVTDDDRTDFSELGLVKLYGIAGNDQLATGAPGQVYLDGGEGDDYLATTWDLGPTTGEFYGGSGNDRIQGGSSAAGDDIYGGSGDDWVEQNFTGGGGPDHIEGGRGRDALYGEKGGDSIFGGDGNESGAPIAAGGVANVDPGLFGGIGNDSLYGGRGSDLLVGGEGRDRQYGGEGSDVFQFRLVTDSTRAQPDTIFDYVSGELIDLLQVDAKDGNGNQAFSFINKAAFSGVKGELRFKGGKLEGDTSGDGIADFSVKLPGVTVMKATWIEL